MNAHLPGVTVHGRVASAEEFTKNYGISVIPLLSGSGVRIKLLQNGCHGIPTVSTSIGAEGVYSGSDTILPLADDAESFAKQVVKLCTDTQKAYDVAKALHEDISRRFSSVNSIEAILLHGPTRSIHSIDKYSPNWVNLWPLSCRAIAATSQIKTSSSRS